MSTSNEWRIVPENGFVGAILFVLFAYFFVRHFVFVLMIFDILIGWLRQFRWFPVQGKRLRATLHWLLALMLFLGFLAVSGIAGWLEFIPVQNG